jgi:hypothetical protein
LHPPGNGLAERVEKYWRVEMMNKLTEIHNDLFNIWEKLSALEGVEDTVSIAMIEQYVLNAMKLTAVCKQPTRILAADTTGKLYYG